MRLKTGLSIRYKILILLTLVPMVSLSLFLLIAIRIFENDKVAYIYESSAMVSKTLSAQVRTELDAKLITAKPMLQEFVEKRQFGPISQRLIEDESLFSWVAAIRFDQGKFYQLGVIENKSSDSMKLSKIPQLTSMIQEASVQKRILRFPSNSNDAVVVEKVSIGGEDLYFVLMSPLPDIAKGFRTPSSTQNFLVGPTGQIIIGPIGTENSNLAQKTDPKFQEKMKDQKVYLGTEEVKTSKGDSWLVGYSKVSFGGLTVVCMVPKKDALRAIQELIRKSFLLFLMIISITTVIGLVASGTLTKSLTLLFEATRKIAEGHFDMRITVKSNDEIGSLAQSFNAMSKEVSRLLQETSEKARMESELKTAKTVQETLFPKDRATLSGMNIVGHYEPASECGGDWWHYSQVGRKVYLWIGDATGHGAPAALITSAARSAATIIENLNLDPSLSMNLLNQSVYDVSKGQIMMTFFLACFDPDTNTLTYANASHEAPLLIRKSNGIVSKKTLVPLNEVVSPRLGEARDTKYKQFILKLQQGDRLVFYTDGLADIQNQEKQNWGDRELIKAIVRSNQNFPPLHESVHNIVQSFSEYRQNSPLIDDVTFFMTEVASNGGLV